MDLRQFEHNANKKFQDFNPETDGAKLWEQLDQKLPKASETKNRFAWFFLLLPLFAAAVVATNYWNVDNTSQSVNELVSLSSELSDRMIEAEVLSQAENIPQQINDKVEQVYTSVKTSNQAVANVTQKNLSSLNLTNQGNDVLFQNNTKLQSSEILAVKKEYSKRTNDLSKKKENIKDSYLGVISDANPIAKANRQDELNFVDKPDAGTSIESQTIEEMNVTENLVGQEIENKEATNDNLVLLEKSEEEESKLLINEGQLTNDEKVAIQTTSDVELLVFEDETDSSSESESKNFLSKDRNQLKFGIALLGAQGSYTLGVNQDDVFLQSRKNAEEVLETYQFDVAYKYRLTSRFALGLGIRYWNLTERSSHTSIKNYMDNVDDIVIGVIHHPDGSTENILGTVNFNVTETVNATRYISHKSWAIPILAYYRIVDKKKIALDLGLGYEYSLTGSHAGYELDLNQQEYLLTEDVDNRYKKSGGNYLLLELESAMKLTEQLDLNLALLGKYGLDAITTETSLLHKQYNLLGMRLGLSYSF